MWKPAIAGFVMVVAAGVEATPADAACNRYVKLGGSDAAAGTTLGTAWRHLQYAVDHATVPGTTICVESGTYLERVAFSHSGSTSGYITLERDPAALQEVIVDGTSATTYPTAGQQQATLSISNQSFIAIHGLTIVNGGNSGCHDQPPNYCEVVGIWVGDFAGTSPASHHVSITGNSIHDVNPPNDAEIGLPVQVFSWSSQPIHHVSIADNDFGDSDTFAAPSSGGQVIEALVSFAGNVRDFEVRHNTFHDASSGGISTGGNQSAGPTLHPLRGVISDNVFTQVGGQTPLGPTYAIYLQAAEQILVERNDCFACGYGVGVTTETDASPFRSTDTWIRDNLFVETFQSSVVAGAFSGYQDVDNVYITNNTIYDPSTTACSIYLPIDGTHALTGDSRISANISYTTSCHISATLPPGLPAPDHEYHAGPGSPAIWNGPPTTRDGFHLTAATPIPPREAGPTPTPVPAWASTGFGAYTPAAELDQYGGARVNGNLDIGADEQ